MPGPAGPPAGCHPTLQSAYLHQRHDVINELERKYLFLYELCDLSQSAVQLLQPETRFAPYLSAS